MSEGTGCSQSYARLVRKLFCAALTCMSVAASAVVPTPVVTGPIASDFTSASKNYTFFSTDLDLRSRGYVEEEFFYSGTANAYDVKVVGGFNASPTASPTANVVSSGHPYTTRMVVRRPIDPAKFNGIVIVEWNNATSSYDLEVGWFRMHEFLMREGYAYVGITAQSVVITHPKLGLKQFSPERYSTLDLTANGAFTSGDPLSYDVYAQGVQAIRNGTAMGSLRSSVKKVVGLGVSQSAGRMSTYANAIHSRDLNVIDALLLYAGGEKLRTDLKIPIIKLLSETEHAGSTNEIPAMQPDTDSLRTWAMAGTSHSDWASSVVRYVLVKRDQPSVVLGDTCAITTRSRIQDRYGLAAATDWLKKWSTTPNTVPPTALPIALGADNTVQRDSRGNALGGIRYPNFAVPVALDAGNVCGLNGAHVPFDTATLNALYPTHKSYTDQIESAIAKSLAEGFLLPADADEVRRTASVSILGYGLDCGYLCVNVSQFPLHPSTQLLRDHLQFLYVVGADEMLRSIDAATLSLARAYTEPDAAKKNAQFSQGAKWIEQFKSQVLESKANARLGSGQAALLAEYADTLVSELRKVGADPAAVSLDQSVPEFLYGSESGGGCTAGNGRFDPMLYLLLAIAGFWAVRNRRRRLNVKDRLTLST